ncbi:MAG TPA: FAD-dependent 5-carboxymethylaminomethyl-2-thiouridine(34) oxidoreductase MnmC [Caldimonas sp.]
MTDTAAALLCASGLPARWRGCERFVILEAGSDRVDAFVASWQAWRDDMQRCARFHFIALGPLRPAAFDAIPAAARGGELARQLAEAWPPPTKNLHRLSFEAGRVQLLLAPGEPDAWLREIVASVDAFLVADGNSERADWLDRWPRFAKALARIAAPAATFAARRIDRAAADALEAAGFRIDPSGVDAAALGTATARYEPRFVPRRSDARRARAATAQRHALVIGAGLAGCAAAWALAEQGWHSTVLERRAAIALEASGNPAGIFHGIVNGQDGTHARFNRAAALEAHAAATVALAQHAVQGGLDGLLQLVDASVSIATMRALLRRLGLPEGYVLALDTDQASARAGLELQRPTWFYPGGGWISPAGLARSFLERAAPSVELWFGSAVTELRREDNAWELRDAAGRLIERAETVVLANAGEALRLLGGAWPVEAVRGQLSFVRVADAPALRLPRLPISGDGYLLPEVEGLALFGATANRDDDDPAVRTRDHVRNLAQLGRLAPACGVATLVGAERLQGRAAWRWVSRDRLPLIGPVPRGRGATPANACAVSARFDQLRFVPREPGLFVFTALGSRGIAWAALGAQVLASSITGAPAPVEASLVDALDPARFQVREGRRRAA